MRKNLLGTLIVTGLFALGRCESMVGEEPYGRGLTEANKERFLIDDMELLLFAGNGVHRADLLTGQAAGAFIIYGIGD